MTFSLSALQDVVRSWYSRLPSIVSNTEQLVRNAEECALACTDGEMRWILYCGRDNALLSCGWLLNILLFQPRGSYASLYSDLMWFDTFYNVKTFLLSYPECIYCRYTATFSCHMFMSLLFCSLQAKKLTYSIFCQKQNMGFWEEVINNTPSTVPSRRPVQANVHVMIFL